MSEVTLTVWQPKGWLTLLAAFRYLSQSRQSLLNSMEVQISPYTHTKKEQSSLRLLHALTCSCIVTMHFGDEMFCSIENAFGY